MKERPILFSPEMVLAILNGKKTQTRRLIKPQPHQSLFEPSMLHVTGVTKTKQVIKDIVIPKGSRYHASVSMIEFAKQCPYGQPGDQLWVREKSRIGANGWHYIDGDWHCIEYAAGLTGIIHKKEAPKHYPAISHNKNGSLRWQPSIHMPRWASRIQLEITAVRVERLRDISESDAAAEGVPGKEEAIAAGLSWYDKPRRAFRFLWQRINGKASWDENPLVWVVEFKRIYPGA